MNRLSTSKRALMINMMCEGMSARSISRVVDVSINTVYRLLRAAGEACTEFHDHRVRGLTCRRVQADELWSFAYCKAKNVATAKAAPIGAGDIWLWIVLDHDSRLIVSWVVGERTAPFASALMQDARNRIGFTRPQLTTDGLLSYPNAVEDAFGADIDYAMLIKMFSIQITEDERRLPQVRRRLSGQRIAADPNNFRQDGQDWLVRSESGSSWYRVSFSSGLECECPDFRNGHECKHILL